MKTLTPKELTELQLKHDEALLIIAKEGELTCAAFDHLEEFVRACQEGRTPVGLVLEGKFEVTLIKTSEIVSNVVLLSVPKALP